MRQLLLYPYSLWVGVSENIVVDLNVKKDGVDEPVQSIKEGVNSLLETTVVLGQETVKWWYCEWWFEKCCLVWYWSWN